MCCIAPFKVVGMTAFFYEKHLILFQRLNSVYEIIRISNSIHISRPSGLFLSTKAVELSDDLAFSPLHTN